MTKIPMLSVRSLLLGVASLCTSTFADAQNVGSIYRIISNGSDKAVTAMGDSLRSAVELADVDEESESQMWALISNSNTETYGLYNIASCRSIDMALQNNGKLLQWKTDLSNTNQVFTIKSPGIAGSAVQLLCASDESKAVTRDANGALWMRQDLTSTDTYFEMVEVADVMEHHIPLPFRTYIITSVASGKAISNGGRMDNDAVIITETPDAKSQGQMWTLNLPALTKTYTNWFQLLNKSCGKCVDAALDAGANAKPPLQWTQDKTLDYPNWNQMFQIVKVEGQTDTYRLLVSKNVGTRWSPEHEFYCFAVNEQGEVYLSKEGEDVGSDAWFRFSPVSDNDLPKGLYWQDETIFEENKEAGHATYIPYSNTDALRADARYAKPWLDPVGSGRWLNLGGMWRLKWNVLDAELTMPGETDFYGDEVDATTWDEVKVPGCLEMQGWGKPLYINVEYAFADQPPYINMKSGLDNSVGSYRRNFTLPEGWENERVLLHFDGIYSAAYVWVNGKWVGYTQGGNMDAEFDITPHVRTGENNISVRVIRWTDGSYLEGQDMWHMSGIHRDVYLVSVPKVFVRDHCIRATYADDMSSALLSVELDLDNRDGLTATKSYEVRLIDPTGNIVDTKTSTVDFEGEPSKTLMLDFEVAKPILWTSDNPLLYTVEIAQRDGVAETEESAFATKYGFCKAEIRDNQFLINNRRTLLKGVNTQDTHPTLGRTMDIETMWKDLTMMKQANVNCVRTSHYPRSAKMNAMMDYLGLYMMDEADVEFHKNWTDNGKIHTSPTWRAAIVDRVERMVLRDRNHPSIVSWSLGNESNGGQNFNYAYDAARALDSRPIHYEGASRAGTSPSDIFSVMYRDVPTVLADVDKKNQPYFMCEYAHAMGHSVGNLQEYWDVMESSRNGMGGCIWDWVDQAIVDAQDIKNGELKLNGFNKYRYGIDYGGPTQGNFVNNGIITADRAWTGKLDEVRRVYQYVKFKGLDDGVLSLRQDYESLSLEGYVLSYSVLKNGAEVQSGSVVLPAVAGLSDAEDTRVAVPYTADFVPGAEYLLNVAVCVPEATSWCEALYPIAQHQFTLQERGALPELDNMGQPLTYESGVISNDLVSIAVSTSGTDKGISEWIMNGVSIIDGSAAPEYSNYRWIENDAPYGTDPQYDASAGITGKSVSVVLADDASSATITQRGTGSWCNYIFVYKVYQCGVVDLKATYTPKAASKPLRRIGLDMSFNPELCNTVYYARGPRSNTVDRKSGSDLGLYALPVSGYHVDYVKPQTCGDRQDLRMITLCDDSGKGVRIDTEGQVNLTLDNYTDSYMHTIRHQWDMETSNAIYAHFDYLQRGIGNGSCGAGVMSKYELPTSGSYTYTLRFTPVGDYDPTGIGDVIAVPSKVASEPVYDLQGRRMSKRSWGTNSLPTGVYVSEGRKVIF